MLHLFYVLAAVFYWLASNTSIYMVYIFKLINLATSLLHLLPPPLTLPLVGSALLRNKLHLTVMLCPLIAFIRAWARGVYVLSTVHTHTHNAGN